MSIKYVAFALDGVKGLTPTERLVLISLAEWADDDGVCWYSQDRIAERVEVSRRQVIRLIDKLEARGIVVRLERLQRSVRYQIRCDVAVSHMTSASYDTAMSHGDVTSGAPDVTKQRHIRCDTAMSHKPPRTTKLEPSSEPSGGADAPKPLPDNGPIQKIVKAWYERAGVEPANYAKALGYAKQLHAARVTPRELSEMYDWYAADPWRVERGFDLGTCVADIEKFRQSQRLPRPASNGRASPGRMSNYDISAANIDAAGEPDDPFGIAGPIYETTGRIRP